MERHEKVKQSTGIRIGLQVLVNELLHGFACAAVPDQADFLWHTPLMRIPFIRVGVMSHVACCFVHEGGARSSYTMV